MGLAEPGWLQRWGESLISRFFFSNRTGFPDRPGVGYLENKGITEDSFFPLSQGSFHHPRKGWLGEKPICRKEAWASLLNLRLKYLPDIEGSEAPAPQEPKVLRFQPMSEAAGSVQPVHRELFPAHIHLH